MEIPYAIKPREDTGLFNAKVGIWLFLASEVMLFGALFSSYILLRVGAESGKWPYEILNIPIGTVNTAVLIISSVTVVMAWASLKMNRYDRFKIFQGATVLCAITFCVIKAFEYKDKWTHYEVWLKDGTSMTGHIEGTPWFWDEQTLQAKKLAGIAFTPDPPAGTHGAEHPPARTIATSDIKRLSAYVPAHSTYFAIYFTLTGLHALHVIGGALVIGYLWGPGSKMWRIQPEQFTNRVEVSGLFWHFVDLVWIFLFPVCTCFSHLSMSTSHSHAPAGAQSQSSGHDHAHDIAKHVKVYVLVFVALLIGTGLTVWLHYVHLQSIALTVGLALLVASVKGFLVAGYFMHLISEKKLIYAVMASTLFFFTGLMGLTVWSYSATPAGTVHYAPLSTRFSPQQHLTP